MKKVRWIIFGMLVALLAGCSGKKTTETSADAKNAESTDEKNTLDFVDAHGERYTVEINEAVAKNPYDKALFVKNENKISYEDKKYTSRLGVDVSVFQGDIDWEQVKAAGYEFAILRIGYRGYGEEGTLNADEKFEQNLENARKAGIDVGVYFFSQAVNEEEAKIVRFIYNRFLNGGTYNAPFMTWLPALFPKFKLHTSDRIHPLFGRKNVHGREEFIRECKETVTALKAFPCISTWVIFNEGWGQFDSKKLTALFRELDDTRLIDSASGWFDRRQGDFKSEHNYFAKQFVTPSDRAFVISEYGGYTCQVKGHTCSGKTYGYKICSSQEEFQAAYHKLMSEEIDPLKEQGLCGAVYTQLSDIEDEINGLMTYDREVCKL